MHSFYATVNIQRLLHQVGFKEAAEASNCAYVGWEVALFKNILRESVFPCFSKLSVKLKALVQARSREWLGAFSFCMNFTEKIDDLETAMNSSWMCLHSSGRRSIWLLLGVEAVIFGSSWILTLTFLVISYLTPSQTFLHMNYLKTVFISSKKRFFWKLPVQLYWKLRRLEFGFILENLSNLGHPWRNNLKLMIA